MAKSESVPPPLLIVIALSVSLTAVIVLPFSDSVPPFTLTFLVAPPRRLFTAVPLLSSASVPVPAIAFVANAVAPAPLSVTRPPFTVRVPVALLSPPVSVCVPAPIFVTLRFAGVAAVNAPAKLAFVPSAPMVSVAVAPLFVTSPPVAGESPRSEPITAVCAFTFSSAPAATVNADPVSTFTAPNCSTPPLIVVPPVQLSPALFSASTPEPAFVRPAPPVAMTPPSVPPRTLVTAGFVTVTVRVTPPKLTTPPSVRLLPVSAPPKVKLPFTVTAFETLRAVPSASSVVPSAMVSAATPAGPAVTMPLDCALAFAKMSVPTFNCTPPLKVLAADERMSEPAPALSNPAGVVPPMVFTMAALMRRSSGEAPVVVAVRFAPLSSSVPEIVGVLAKLSFTEVIAVVVSVSTNVPPVATLGVTEPPPLAKVMLLSVLLPTRVSTPPLLTVTVLVDAIWPALVTSVRLALFRMMFPRTAWLPSTPLRFRVPWFTIVLPVLAFENVESGAAKASAAPGVVDVVAAEIVMLVPLAMVAIVAPFGTPGPKTCMPTARFAVLLRPLMVVLVAVLPVRATLET